MSQGNSVGDGAVTRHVQMAVQQGLAEIFCRWYESECKYNKGMFP
jgi:hypothetical protein